MEVVEEIRIRKKSQGDVTKASWFLCLLKLYKSIHNKNLANIFEGSLLNIKWLGIL